RGKSIMRPRANIIGRVAGIVVACALMTCPAISAASGDKQAVPVKTENQAARPIKDKWALVVGISNFQNPSIDLKYPAKDAKDFQKYLISQANFAADHVKLLINEDATRERILSEL